MYPIKTPLVFKIKSSTSKLLEIVPFMDNNNCIVSMKSVLINPMKSIFKKDALANKSGAKIPMGINTTTLPSRLIN
jgi:hypothetical protein